MPDTIDMHPNARAALDQRGLKLLSLLREDTEPPEKLPPTKASERYPVTPIAADQVLGVRKWKLDNRGRLRAILFWHDTEKKAYGLFDDAYRELKATIEALLKNEWFSSRISTKFLESKIFDWCEAQFRSSAPTSLAETVIQLCEAAVQTHQVWVPVANLEIEESFQFGPVRIEQITQAMLDGDNAKRSQEHREALRTKLQGRVAVAFEIEAERAYAFDRAVEIAKVAIALLRFHSRASLTTWSLTTGDILGSEHTPKATVVYVSNTGRLAISDKLLIEPTSLDWVISKELLAEMRGSTDKLAALVEDRGQLTDFKTTLRASMLAFSKGMTQVDLNDRLVYTLSALEGLLLKDTSEAIQQNIGDRIAFLLYSDPKGRWDTVQNLRDVYRMRSQYLHHRVSLTDRAKLETFIMNAYFVLARALEWSDRIPDRSHFIQLLDQAKYGGPFKPS